MTDEHTDSEKSLIVPTPGTDGTDNSYTFGENTMSLFAQSPVVLEPGLIVLEKFKIIDLLGQGGMGSVYRVEHLLMGRQFALKCLNKFQEADAAWRRFQNEAKAAHLLDHANLLKVYEFGLLPGGQPFFLMELVEGVTLADEIKKLGQLPVDRAVGIFIQVAFAIGYAHESKVIHRDIKPSNIMVYQKAGEDVEHVKILDFGIAKLTGVDEFNQQTLTKTGEIFGSPLYMSPEQCTGIAVDHRSDLYSMGCVFYETLTSAPPFIGESALSTMMKHQGEKPLSLKEASLGTQYPQMLEEIVSKLLEKDPANRYQSANAVAKDLIKLERRLTEESKSTLEPVGTTQVLKKPEFEKKETTISLTPSNTSLILLSVGVIFALGALTSYVCFYPQQEKPVPTRLFFDRSSSGAESATSTGSDTNGDAATDAAAQLKKEDPQYEESVRQSTYWSSVRGQTRRYRFPQKQSIGIILTAGGGIHQATGEFTVHTDDLIGFVPNDYLMNHPELMDKFQPNELTLIDLNSQRAKSPGFYSKLANFPKLKFFNAFYSQLKSNLPVLGKLTELLYLDVAWNDIDCRQLLKYIHPEKLNYLNITSTDHPTAVLQNLGKFPKLRQLIAAKCDLQDTDLSVISESKVSTLCLGWNEDITNKGVANLSGLKSLVRLDLSFTDVTPEVWQELTAFPKLQTVKVASMRWSDRQKLIFAKQMRIHAPNVLVDTDSTNFKEFTVAVTDIEWLNRGTDAHDWPMKQELNNNAQFIDGKLQ